MEVGRRPDGVTSMVSWGDRTVARASTHAERFSLGQVNSMKCYWSQVIPQSFCLKEQGDPWDVLMIVAERCYERSESIIPVRTGSKEVAMEDTEESTKISWERIS